MQCLNFCQALRLAFCSHTVIAVKQCPLFQTNFLPSGYDGRILRLVEHRKRYPISTTSALNSFTMCCVGILPKLHTLWMKFTQHNGTFLPNYTASLFIRPSYSHTYFRALHNFPKLCSHYNDYRHWSTITTELLYQNLIHVLLGAKTWNLAFKKHIIWKCNTLSTEQFSKSNLATKKCLQSP
jgi:hypothetical protein